MRRASLVSCSHSVDVDQAASASRVLGLKAMRHHRRPGQRRRQRHRKVLRDNIQGITKPAIRRWPCVEESSASPASSTRKTRGVLKVCLENVIRDAVTYTERTPSARPSPPWTCLRAQAPGAAPSMARRLSSHAFVGQPPISLKGCSIVVSVTFPVFIGCGVQWAVNCVLDSMLLGIALGLVVHILNINTKNAQQSELSNPFSPNGYVWGAAATFSIIKMALTSGFTAR
ncbi:hypothetical protein U0070_007366 [Myodes glareolus]|uniref:Histone H4 n=1 Tax=Myodes glareolus TaxID=447135 RepID=A0AAW0GY48_MYOGA